MTLQEVINNIKSLGFSDDAEMDEFAESGVLYDSINRAVSIISREVKPIIGEYRIEQDGTDEEYNYYDMRELTKMDGKQTFLSFRKNPVMIENSSGVGYKPFSDFDIEQDSILVLAPEVEGTFKIFYRKDHVPYTADTDLNTELELPLATHDLVPLLAGYYVWLEDEPTKAAQYYNLYEQGKEAILTEQDNITNRIRVRVLPGGM